jgi:hypothetical protein
MKRYFFVLISFFIFSHYQFVYSESSKWENYYNDTINITQPHNTLLLAIRFFEEENIHGGRAADVGAGTGRDTLFLLKSGWHVLSVDAEPLAIDIILGRVNCADSSNLEALGGVLALRS